MDTRTALKNGTVLRFDNGTVKYTIQNEHARGGASIVYNAFYTDNVGNQKPVFIKECYPFKLEISRDHMENLIPAESDMEKFEQAKGRMREAYNIGNVLFKTDGLTNFIDNTYNLYKQNNTIYTVSAYSQGEVLSCNAINSLKEGIAVVKSVAIAIQKIHDRGYLYLDIKPDNVFVFKETTDIVRLFDFDTLIPVDIAERNKSSYDYQISYTKGFASLEQKEGNKSKIGKYSDVYGIGALLFYLMFNRVPDALDCDYDADYDFSSLVKFSKGEYQDKLCFKLTDFFHHTLAHYYLDRFQNMEDVIKTLDELIGLSDTSKPFIYSSKISKPKFMVGRDKESEYLTEWFAQNAQNCLFIVGMGGIGKSTLMHFFLAKNIDKFDTVIYVNYNTSIVRTIIDDVEIRINTIEQEERESSNEYFKRKLSVIRELAIGKNIILVIDNYTGEAVQDFSAILNIDWKIVLITRNKSLAEGYKMLELSAIQNSKTLYSLFEIYLGRTLNKNEYLYLDNIIEKVAGHTLILELIAKQVVKSYIPLAEVSNLVDKHGFSNIAPEKIDYRKDSVTYHETIENIIYNLFDIACLSEKKRMLLKIISLFGTNGVDINILADMLKLSSKDGINELISESWISTNNMHISMHPVIIETICQCDLTEDSKKVAMRVMDFLFCQIRLEAKPEEYPLKLLKRFEEGRKVRASIEDIKRMLESSNNSKFVRFLVRICEWMLRKMTETPPVSDSIRYIVHERVRRGSEERTTDQQKLNVYLRLSESFLEGCKKENSIFVSDNYKNLMYETMINMPYKSEDFLYSAEELVKDPVFHSKKNRVNLLNLYADIILFYEEKEDFLTAKGKLEEAKSILRYHDDSVSGEYHFLLARHYAGMICNTAISEGEKYIKLFKHNINKAIRYMKKSRRPDRGQLLGKYYYFKACIFIKEGIGNPNEIKTLLNKAKRLIEENAQSQSSLIRDCYMAYAQYYTYIEHDYTKVIAYIVKSYWITIKISQTDLDIIYDTISIIDIVTEWGKYENAVSLIESSIERCNKHKNMLVYLQAKIELLGRWLNISYKKQDFETCKVILKAIEEDAETVGKNMNQIVPAHLQKEIYSK